MKFLLMMITSLLAAPLQAETFAVPPGPDAESVLQEALILAQPGDEVVTEIEQVGALINTIQTI